MRNTLELTSEVLHKRMTLVLDMGNRTFSPSASLVAFGTKL